MQGQVLKRAGSFANRKVSSGDLGKIVFAVCSFSLCHFCYIELNIIKEYLNTFACLVESLNCI